MSPPDPDDNANKKPQIGRREIGVLLLLLAINWASVLLFYGAAPQRVAIPYSPTFQAETLEGPEAYAAAGLQPAAAATPPAESATLVAS